MATIPPRFLYENARAYFKGELDKENSRKFERILEHELEYRKLSKESDDWMYLAPIAIGIFCGLL